MKRLVTAIAALACAFALLAMAPSPGFAGGGHGYKHHNGYKHHGRHRGYGHYGRHYGHRRGHRSGASFNFSFYGPSRTYGPRYAYPRYYQPPQVIYVQPPTQYVQPPAQYVQPPVQYVQPAPSYSEPPQVQPQQNCLVVREYQTQITVGGKLVDAYGDACMKADGSWERGPAKAVQY